MLYSMPMASARETKLRRTDACSNRPGIGVTQVVAGAGPAEFGDHDPLARELIAQKLIKIDRLIDSLFAGEIFPIGQDVRGDEIDGVTELRIVTPDVPDFAGRDRDVDRFPDPLDQLDQVVDLLVAAVDGFVADNDADDVAVALGEIDRGIDFALVVLVLLVDPRAHHDFEPEFGRDRRHQFVAFR